MTAAIGLGILGGLFAVLVSEALLKLLVRFKAWDPIPVSLGGVLIRGSWILICLLLGVNGMDPAAGQAFAVALLGTYLVAQVAEGFRFEKAVRNR
jgi:H+/Cl- antiporter ClcA